MKKNDMVKIELEGKKVTARFLGAGAFSKVYEFDGMVYAFTAIGDNETDMSKEGVALYAYGAHVPEIEKFDADDNYYVYRMPLYSPLTPSHKEAWKQYRTLESVWSNVCPMSGRKAKSGYTFNQDFLQALSGQVSSELYESVESICDALSNYSEDYQVEIAKRNLAVDNTGKLILLDIIFNKKANLEIIRKKSRKEKLTQKEPAIIAGSFFACSIG